jgi:translation elongation factor EF-G
MGDRAGAKTIKADVPLSEMFGCNMTERHLVEQHLLWNFHYAETPSYFRSSNQKQRRLIFKKMSQN